MLLEGIVGEGITLDVKHLGSIRPSTVSFNLAKHLLYTSFRDEDGFPKQHLFPQIQRLARRWLDDGGLSLVIEREADGDWPSITQSPDVLCDSLGLEDLFIEVVQ